MDRLKNIQRILVRSNDHAQNQEVSSGIKVEANAAHPSVNIVTTSSMTYEETAAIENIRYCSLF